MDKFEMGPTLASHGDYEIIYQARTQGIIVTIKEITKLKYTTK
jgi:hypothetical protein